jgi:hypothetical protein
LTLNHPKMNPPRINPVSIPHSMLVLSLGNSARDVYCSATTVVAATMRTIRNFELRAGRRYEGLGGWGGGFVIE